MDRRRFLSAITTAAAAIAVDPERFLWTKTKTIFVPPASGRYVLTVTGMERALLGDLLVGDVITLGDNPSRRFVVAGHFIESNLLQVKPWFDYPS